MPLPPAGELKVRDVTHSTMRLLWDAAPGAVRKYLITYKPEEGDAKEVSLVPIFSFLLIIIWHYILHGVHVSKMLATNVFTNPILKCFSWTCIEIVVCLNH